MNCLETILKQIQPILINHANAVADVIKIEVEITDENLERIAGSGVFKRKLGVSIENEGFVHKKTLRTGEVQIIDNPGNNSSCVGCSLEKNCKETFEISAPIKMKQKIIGTLALVCFEEDEKKRVMEDLEAYLKFLDRMTEFISMKACESQEQEQVKDTIKMLNGVIDKVNEGVIIFNNEWKIVEINKSAMIQLKIDKGVLNRQVILKVTGDMLDNNEYQLTLGTKIYTLIGEVYETNYAKGLIFKEIKYTKTMVHEFVETMPQNKELFDIYGNSKIILNLRRRIFKIADSTSPVLITGESGTAKELFARAIWSESNRRNCPFIVMNCSRIKEESLDQELFGYTKGAVATAEGCGKVGKLELANNGILYLDEIADLSLYIQSKLLKVLQERKMSRIGSSQQINLNVRIIASTSKNLPELIKQNLFKKNLYYSLNVISLNIPPLREHRDDIPELFDNFVKRFAVLFKKSFRKADEEVINILSEYPWHGNIDELEHSVEYMINLMKEDGLITKSMLPQSILESYEETNTLIRKLDDLEREEIEKALKIYGNSKKGKVAAAEKLGLGITTLYRKIKKYDL